MANWNRIDRKKPPTSTPLKQTWVLVFCPNDDWGALGHVHVGCFYEHDEPGMARVQGSTHPRRATHWRYETGPKGEQQ